MFSLFQLAKVNINDILTKKRQSVIRKRSSEINTLDTLKENETQSPKTTLNPAGSPLSGMCCIFVGISSGFVSWNIYTNVYFRSFYPSVFKLGFVRMETIWLWTKTLSRSLKVIPNERKKQLLIELLSLQIQIHMYVPPESTTPGIHVFSFRTLLSLKLFYLSPFIPQEPTTPRNCHP